MLGNGQTRTYHLFDVAEYFGRDDR